MVANGFEGVAWMVGGGAKHSANLGRVLAYAATMGAEGVIAPGDLKVSPSSGQVDAYVHIATGAVAMRNRYANARSETYIGRGVDVSDVKVGSTGSLPRSDLIVARIRDPQYGAQPPADLANGPYVFPDIIPGVPANTESAAELNLSEPMYALARIDMPPNTDVVTLGAIKDLRELVLPRSRREMFSNNCGASPTTLTATEYTEWPSVKMSVKVPDWATHANMRIDISGILQLSAMADAEIVAQIGDGPVSGPMGLDNDGWTDGIRLGATITVGPTDVTDWRGQTIICHALARRVASGDGVHTGMFRVDGSTHVGFDIQFDEKAV